MPFQRQKNRTGIIAYNEVLSICIKRFFELGNKKAGCNPATEMRSLSLVLLLPLLLPPTFSVSTLENPTCRAVGQVFVRMTATFALIPIAAHVPPCVFGSAPFAFLATPAVQDPMSYYGNDGHHDSRRDGYLDVPLCRRDCREREQNNKNKAHESLRRLWVRSGQSRGHRCRVK